MSSQIFPFIRLPVPVVSATYMTDAMVREGRRHEGDYFSRHCEIQGAPGTGFFDSEDRTAKPLVRKVMNQSPVSSLIGTMGESAAIQAIQREVELVARTNFSILVTGESGAGKELVSQAIHTLSLRADKPLVAVDCGAIAESLIESELFGHEKGAFTGAHQAKAGAFELANGGTIFLDEIGNLPLAMQGKLLRVLETRKIHRLGSTTVQAVDFRVVAATNADLLAMVGKHSFRGDLYHRLAEYTIRVPALRERKEDMNFLVGKFLAQANNELGKRVKGLSVGASTVLRRHDLPGNARELRNMLRRAVLLCDEPTGLIEPELLDRLMPASKISQISVQKQVHSESSRHKSCPICAPEEFQISGVDAPLKDMVALVTAQVERAMLIRTLALTQGNKAKAARTLKIDNKTLHSKLKTYEISSLQYGGLKG